MKYYQLLENRDYSIAKKLRNKLSNEAHKLLMLWAESPNSVDLNPLNNAFRDNTPIAQEIWETGQPIRDNIRNREGDSIVLYRGLVSESKNIKNRVLFSWTSSEAVARRFARDHKEPSATAYTDEKIDMMIKKLENNGFLNFLGVRYIRSKRNPEKCASYSKLAGYGYKTEYPNFETMLNEIKTIMKIYKERTTEIKNLGKVIQKSIPVDNIIWVLMENSENEYIVKGNF